MAFSDRRFSRPLARPSAGFGSAGAGAAIAVLMQPFLNVEKAFVLRLPVQAASHFLPYCARVAAPASAAATSDTAEASTTANVIVLRIFPPCVDGFRSS